MNQVLGRGKKHLKSKNKDKDYKELFLSLVP